MKKAFKIILSVLIIFLLLSALLAYLVFSGHIECNFLITNGPRVEDSFMCPIIGFLGYIWYFISLPFSPFF